MDKQQDHFVTIKSMHINLHSGNIYTIHTNRNSNLLIHKLIAYCRRISSQIGTSAFATNKHEIWVLDKIAEGGIFAWADDSRHCGFKIAFEASRKREPISHCNLVICRMGWATRCLCRHQTISNILSDCHLSSRNICIICFASVCS